MPTLKPFYAAASKPPKKIQEQVSLGYYYPLSSRTTIYGDVVYDDRGGSKYPGYATKGKCRTGYDFGIRHDF